MVVKNVVKVMNFHSLLRVDNAKRKANMYFNVENELKKLIKRIFFNKNLILDKKLIKPNEHAGILSIYIGNDYGFCGDFNLLINKEVRNDSNPKITIGKKINNEFKTNVLLDMSKEEYYVRFGEINDIIYDAIKLGKYKEINIVYNHYYSVSKLGFQKKRVYPIDIELDENDYIDYDEDFISETKIDEMLNNFIALYICYEIKICEMNSYAAENVMRQSITKEALKRIEEKEEEDYKLQLKAKKQVEFQKIVDNFRKGI